MTYRHSERAKSNTKQALIGILEMLNENLFNLEIDLGETNNWFFARGIKKNIADRKAQIKYYNELWDEYEERGLI